VHYTLTDDNELQICYRAQSNKDTIINLTNHAFFNLNGEGKDLVDNHEVRIDADHYLPINSVQIPTGEKKDCKGSDFDFITPKSLSVLGSSSDEQITTSQGFNHTFILRQSDKPLKEAVANVVSPLTGIELEVY